MCKHQSGKKASPTPCQQVQKGQRTQIEMEETLQGSISVRDENYDKKKGIHRAIMDTLYHP